MVGYIQQTAPPAHPLLVQGRLGLGLCLLELLLALDDLLVELAVVALRHGGGSSSLCLLGLLGRLLGSLLVGGGGLLAGLSDLRFLPTLAFSLRAFFSSSVASATTSLASTKISSVCQMGRATDSGDLMKTALRFLTPWGIQRAMRPSATAVMLAASSAGPMLARPTRTATLVEGVRLT